jgi:hypothetical protein
MVGGVCTPLSRFKSGGQDSAHDRLEFYDARLIDLEIARTV